MGTLRPVLAILALPLLFALEASAVEATTERADGARVEARLADDDAELVILVSSEHRGDPEACGCGVRPLGGLARQQTYVEAVEATGTPSLVLHAGGWLASEADQGVITDASRAANARMMRALRGVRVDALNAGWPDVAALELARPGLVSATLRADVPVLEADVHAVGGVRVAVTGVTRGGPAYLWREGTEVRDAVQAVAAVRDRVEADLLVVLVYDDPEAAVAVARLPGVDLVVEAGGYTARWPAVVEGEAVRVRTWDQGARLTELRLWRDPDGPLARVLHREVDLDEALDR